jgi:hypothetical protein
LIDIVQRPANAFHGRLCPMPFCPKCQYEYNSTVKTCPECKEDLVDQFEDMPSVDDFSEVYMVSNRMEADVVRSILEENGIDYLIRDLRMFPVLPDFGRRARLRVAVPQRQEAQARKVLEEARSDGALTEQGRFL